MESAGLVCRVVGCLAEIVGVAVEAANSILSVAAAAGRTRRAVAAVAAAVVVVEEEARPPPRPVTVVAMVALALVDRNSGLDNSRWR